MPALAAMLQELVDHRQAADEVRLDPQPVGNKVVTFPTRQPDTEERPYFPNL